MRLFSQEAEVYEYIWSIIIRINGGRRKCYVRRWPKKGNSI